MKAFQKIFSVTLITALLFSGLHLFQSEDASRDNRVDLKDVILLVKVFEGTAENLTDFRDSIQNMVSALQVTAGMKTVIKDSDESRTSGSFSGLDLTCIKSVSALPESLASAVYRNESTLDFKSITTAPTLPPPQFC